MKKAFLDTPGLIRFAGEEMFGENWKTRLAEGLGISRTTLRSLLLGLHKRRSYIDIESELVALIDRERDASAERGVELSALRKAVIAATAKDHADAVA